MGIIALIGFISTSLSAQIMSNPPEEDSVSAPSLEEHKAGAPYGRAASQGGKQNLRH